MATASLATPTRDTLNPNETCGGMVRSALGEGVSLHGASLADFIVHLAIPGSWDRPYRHRALTRHAWHGLNGSDPHLVTTWACQDCKKQTVGTFPSI